MKRRGFFARLAGAITGLVWFFFAETRVKADDFSMRVRRFVRVGSELVFLDRGELSAKMSPLRGLSRNSTTAEVADALMKEMDLVRREMTAHQLTTQQRFACEQTYCTIWGIATSIMRPEEYAARSA